jgi:glycosyltransferase involved in cell wall biosynthesis
VALTEGSTGATAKPLRLVFVAHPNSIHTRRWTAWFARAGHDVTILDPVGIEVEAGLEDVTVRRIGSSRLPGWPGRRRSMRRALDSLRPDVVHAHYLARFGWSAALASIRPLVVTPWGSDLLQVRPRQVRTRLWNRFTLRRADLVTVSSEGMRTAAIAAGAHAERVRLVRHGVETARFTDGAADPELVARVGTDGAPVILSPRTIRPLYRHDVILEAVALLSRRSGTRPLLVVSALGADPATLANLRRRAGALGIGDRLRVLDAVTPAELPDLYRLADVVVSVPETDSFAVTLLEAMACERPIVASDVPAVAPILADLHPLAVELVVPIGDVERTATAIERALSLTDAERSAMGSALRRHVVETADYDTSMAAMEHIYRDLAAASG